MNTSIVIRRTADEYWIKQEAISSLQDRLIDLDFMGSRDVIIAAINQLERECNEIRKSILLNVTL